MARLRDVLRAGALAVGRLAAQASGSYWDAYRAIRDAGYGLTQSQLYRAATAAYEAAGKFLTFTAPDTQALVPIRVAEPILPSESIFPFRYIVNVQWNDPTTGQLQSERYGINSEERLTGAELRQLAIDRARLQAGYSQYPTDREQAAPPASTPDDSLTVNVLHFLTQPGAA